MRLTQGFHQIGNESIYYEKSLIDDTPCRTLVLHGAGASDITRTTTLRQALFDIGIPTLAIDFSGHGKSTSNEVFSIRKRIHEAREIVHRYLDTKESVQIIGFSMSGEVAIRLTQSFPVKSLVLFAPGVYHHEAIDIPFGEKFTTLIRSHESWKYNSISDILSSYRGYISLLTPENDTVIPEGVNEMIMECAPMAYKERIIIKDAPHMVGKWMNEHPERIQDFIDNLHLI